MTTTTELHLPVRTRSEANLREHWAVRSKRAKEHRSAAYLLVKCWRGAIPKRANYIVTLTRVGVRKLDSDNLARSMKAVRDGVADALGIDDGSERIEWRYAQEKGKPKEYAVKIKIGKGEPYGNRDNRREY